MAEVMEVDVNELAQGFNSRISYHEEEMLELMRSMKAQGLLQPIGVRNDKTNGKWEVVFGNRRVLAAKKLGWKKISAILVDIGSKPQNLIEANVVENAVRVDPSAIEHGIAYKALLAEGLTKSEISTRTGLDRKKIERCLEALSTIPEEHRKKVAPVAKQAKRKTGTISAELALRIEYAKRAGHITAGQANGFYEKVASGELTVRKVLLILKEAKDKSGNLNLEKEIKELKEINIQFTCSQKGIKKYNFKTTKQIGYAVRALAKRSYPGLFH